MTRLAIFCEGLTEQLFCERLVTAIVGRKGLIHSAKLRGPDGRRRLSYITAKKQEPEHEFYIQIVDCGGGGDECVLSDIRERYESLTTTGGFTAIIALRDVYPRARADLAALQLAARKYMKTKPVKVTSVFSIMETEAWFLAEHEHFAFIGLAITLERIRAELGFDPSVDDMQLRNHPAEDLDLVYKIGGDSYFDDENQRKTFVKIKRTIDALNIDRIYLELGDRYAPLRELNQAIDAILG